MSDPNSLVKALSPSVLLLIIVAASAYFINDQQRQLDSCRMEVQTVLRQRDDVLEMSRRSAVITPSQEPPVVTTTTLAEAAASTLPAPASQDDRSDLNEFWADERLKQASNVLALNDGERAKVREEFLRTPRLPVAVVLENALGAERYSEYERNVDVRAREQLAENRERDVLYYSRLLNLNAEQESATRAALERVQDSLAPLRSQVDEEMQTLHRAPGDNRSELREQYRALRSVMETQSKLEKQLIAEELSGVLSDEQLNALLADKAKEPFPFTK